MTITRNFGADTPNARVQGQLIDDAMAWPAVPSPGLVTLGPRVTLNFVKEPWSNKNEYQYYDVVLVDGNSYIARQNVPTGVDINDTDYWILWHEPNAQFAELQNTVMTFDGRITSNTNAAAAAQAAATAANNNANGRAPKVHSSSDPSAYGQGTATLYGHVNLSDTPGTTGASAGTAATPLGVHSAIILGATRHAVIIGDSFSAADYTDATGAWFTPVCKALGVTPHNFAISGTGYVAGTATTKYSGQIATAAADNSFDNAFVEFCFICGALNDINRVLSNTLQPAVQQTIVAAQQAFPNARIIVVGPNTWNSFNVSSDSSMSTYEAKNTLANACQIEGAFFVNSMFMGVGTMRYTNRSHPDSVLQKRLGSIVLHNLLGMSDGYAELQYLFVTEDVETADPNFTVSAGMYIKDHLELNFVIKGGSTKVEQSTFTMPFNIAYPFKVYNTGASANGDVVTLSTFTTGYGQGIKFNVFEILPNVTYYVCYDLPQFV